MELQNIINQAWEKRELLETNQTKDAIREVIKLLDAGKLRVAEPQGDMWIVNDWVKKAVIMYFPTLLSH